MKNPEAHVWLVIFSAFVLAVWVGTVNAVRKLARIAQGRDGS